MILNNNNNNNNTECFNDTYFKCDKGLCLPPSLLCNGIKDCLDGSDEAEICSQFFLYFDYYFFILEKLFNN